MGSLFADWSPSYSPILHFFFFSTGFYSPYRTLAFLNGLLDPPILHYTPKMLTFPPLLIFHVTKETREFVWFCAWDKVSRPRLHFGLFLFSCHRARYAACPDWEVISVPPKDQSEATLLARCHKAHGFRPFVSQCVQYWQIPIPVKLS
jgi:hypothetical protein